MVGRYSTEGPLYDQEDTSASEDWFYLQMQIKSMQAEEKYCEPQHLVTNLQYKLKPNRKRTKLLRAKIDTCSNINMMPVSVYKLLYKDPDCTKIAPSKKNGIYTYTNEKIPVIGSCELFVLHPDTKCFEKVSFQVVNIEGSVIVSYATSINFNLIKIHSELDTSVPDCTRLFYSCAHDPDKHQYRKHQADRNCQTKMWPEKPSMKNMNMQSVTNSKNNKWSIPIRKQENDKNCQFRCVNERVQTDQCVMTQSVNIQWKQCVLTKTVKKPICSQWSQFQKSTEDCARTKPANQQDVTRWSLTHRRGRKYSTISQVNQEDISLDVTSTRNWVPELSCINMDRNK